MKPFMAGRSSSVGSSVAALLLLEQGYEADGLVDEKPERTRYG
jgi:tRNA U34 2-thiouridine synthase MnmA/TrmU